MQYKIIDKILKVLLVLVFVISIFMINFYCVKAATTTVTKGTTTANVRLRKGPGTSYGSYGTIPSGTTLTLQSTSTDEGGCETTGYWYKVTYSGNTGYVCATLIGNVQTVTTEEITSDMASMTDEEFETYLDSQGFPESYKTKLIALHALHPNWVFVGINTRATWATALENENVSGRSLYQSTSSSTQGYLSTDDSFYNWYTDTFKAMDGSTWFQASSDTIAYYMDPRNFLTESGIFMFEDLNYYSSYQTSDAVSVILYTSFYTDLIQYYIEAASTYNVSPIYLAALSRQEVGLTDGSTAYAINGSAGAYCDNTSYNGYYNFYNIQATSGTKPVCNGLAYAVTKGWNTKQKAIVGGASWIVSGYIDAGQNTPYFQKWNTSSNATKDWYHQYMTNVKGVVSSASTTYTSYKNMDIIDLPIVFQIPIYSGMPSSTSLPATGNPNNYLKTLTVDGTSVTNFDGATTSYTVNVVAGTTSVKIAGTTVNSNATISGTGTITLTSDTTTSKVTVKAQNGDTKTYTITIVRSSSGSSSNDDDDDKSGSKDETTTYLTPDETLTTAGYKITSSTYMTNVTLGSTIAGTISKLQTANPYASINITTSSNSAKTSGSIVTGDKIIITSNGTTKTYTVVIYGDTNGDGAITTLDLLIVQKVILKKTTLTGAYLKAADVNKDGSVTTLDLLLIQKHILKKSNISQS